MRKYLLVLIILSIFGFYIWQLQKKTAPAVTTQVRLVFNCLLRTGGSPSLNKAAYREINLMADLLGLLMHFCANKITMLVDVKKKHFLK